MHAQELKVAYCSDNPPYQYTTTANEADGLIIDFWRLWSQRNNISIHFIPATLDEGIALLKSGKADVHSCTTLDLKNDHSLYQGPAIFESNAIVFTDKDIEYSGSFKELSAYRVGVVDKELTQTYLENHSPNTAIVSFPDYPHLIDAVAEGRVKVFAADALATFFHLNKKEILNSFYYNRLESLFTTEWRPTMLAANIELQCLIRSGLEAIPGTAKQKVLRRWSSGIPHTVTDAIVIATPIKYPPLSVIGSDGTARGYLIDFWREWGRQVNREIQFRGSVWTETLQGVKSGEADIHSGLFKNEERKAWLEFSHPFFVVETALFHKVGKSEIPSLNKLVGKTVGAIQGSFQEAFLNKEYPSLQVIGYSDLDRMFIALFQDEIKAIVAEEPEVVGNLNRLGLSGTVQKGEKLFQNDIYAGVLKENKELIALVNKGINAIPERTKKEIQERYFPSSFPLTKMLSWAAAGLGFSLIIISFILVNNKKLNTLVKKRTESLRKTKEEWVYTFDAMSDIITIQDKEMSIVRANKAAHDFFQAKHGELNGKYCYELFTGASEPCSECPLLATLQDTGKHSIIIRHENLDKFFHVSSSPILADNGEAQYLVHVAKDITEEKKQEQLTKKISKDQEQLKRFESLKTMAGAIAHRFNNAMMAVQGNLELMTLTLPVGSSEYDMASDAAKAASGASQVGSMMLSYVGQKPLQLQEVSIADLVKESVTALKNVFPDTITLNVTPPAQPLYCSIDQQQIKEVLESILTNAFESMEDNTGTIEITFGSKYFTTDSFSVPFHNDNLQDGMYIFCQIKDSGYGITPKKLSRIFEPFYTTKFVGRGLGLALTVGIMQSHHGAITIESVPGQGTTARILLPSTSSTQQTIPSDDFQGEAVKLSGNILIADDEERVLDVGRKMLEILGLTVHTAVNGLEAVEKISRNDIDFCAVVLDISMPIMDGIEAMNKIRGINPTLPILLSSGYSEDDLPFKEGKGNKPDGFLGKPFELSDMRSSLEKLMS